MDTRQFLDAIYRDRPGHFTLHYRAKVNLMTKTLSNVDRAMEAIALLNEKRLDVWMSLGKSGTVPAKGSRIKEREVISIPGFWADVDIAGPGHKTDKALPETVDQARALLISPEPTITVSTGGGIHGYWLFDEPWEFEAGDQEPVDASKAWYGMLSERAAAFGWHIDNVNDLARFLRVPGTVNYKDLEFPRQVEVLAEGPTYPRDYLVGMVRVRPKLKVDHVVDADIAWARETIEANGWTHCQGDKWARPGKDCHAGLSAQVHPWGMYVYSDAADIPRGWHSPRQIAKLYDVTLTKTADSFHDEAVEREAEKLRVRNEARSLVNRELLSDLPVPEWQSYEDLGLDMEPDTYRIDGLLPAQGRVLIAAVKKTGKTTLIINVVKALVDGGLFLGTYETVPVHGKVAVADFEMGRSKLYSWYRDSKITQTDQILLLSLRGQAGMFNLLDAARRTALAEGLIGKGAEVLVLDPIRPLMAVMGLDENSNADVGRFLDAVDLLKNEAQLAEVILVHHAGHEGNRPRGASTLADWPDAIWYYSKPGDDDDDDMRYLRAEGRDVDMRKSEVFYDFDTRILSLADDPRPRATREAEESIMTLLRGETELSFRKIKDGTGQGQDALEKRLDHMVGMGWINFRPGPNRAKLYSLPDPGSEPDDFLIPGLS